MRRLRLLGVAAVVGALMVLGATPAWAHANLLESAPGTGAVVATAPERVTLRYDQPVSTAFGAVKILAPDGRRVDADEVTTADGGRVVAAPLRPGLPAGTYTILWRVLSQDNHTIFGSSTFSVGQPSTTVAGVAAEEEAGGGRGAATLLDAGRALLFTGLVLLLGGLAFLLVLWPAGAASRAARRVLWTGWVLAVLGSAGTLLLQGPYASGQPLAAVLDQRLLGAVLGSRYGVVSVVRLALLAAAAALLHRLDRFPSRALTAVAATAGTALLVSTSVLGHAGGYAVVGPDLPADVLHLAAACAWLGGLVLLAVAVLRREPGELRAVLPRWSRYATVAVVVLVASGTYAGWREVREWGALTGTEYGVLLLGKTALVALMLGLAALGRIAVRRRYGSPEAAGPEPHSAGAGPGGGTVTRVRPVARPAAAGLRRSVALEAGIAAVVVAVTAVLVGSTPAKDSWFPPVVRSAPVVGGLEVQVEVRPARTGLNQLRLTYTGPGGRPTEVIRASARFVEEAAVDGAEPVVVPVALLRSGPGRYGAGAVLLPSAGTWQLAVTTQTSDIDATTTLFRVRVR